MKRFFILALLAICVSTAASAQEKAKVAVYVTGSLESVEMNLVSTKAISRISTSDKYCALERSEAFLQAMRQEEDYQLSGEVSLDQIAKLGAKHGAKYVAVFDVIKTSDGYCSMTARLVEGESGIVIKSVDQERTIKTTPDLVALTNNVAYRLFFQ